MWLIVCVQQQLKHCVLSTKIYKKCRQLFELERKHSSEEFFCLPRYVRNNKCWRTAWHLLVSWCARFRELERNGCISARKHRDSAAELGASSLITWHAADARCLWWSWSWICSEALSRNTEHFSWALLLRYTYLNIIANQFKRNKQNKAIPPSPHSHTQKACMTK